MDESADTDTVWSDYRNGGNFFLGGCAVLRFCDGFALLLLLLAVLEINDRPTWNLVLLFGIVHIAESILGLAHAFIVVEVAKSDQKRQFMDRLYACQNVAFVICFFDFWFIVVPPIVHAIFTLTSFWKWALVFINIVIFFVDLSIVRFNCNFINKIIKFNIERDSRRLNELGPNVIISRGRGRRGQARRNRRNGN